MPARSSPGVCSVSVTPITTVYTLQEAARKLGVTYRKAEELRDDLILMSYHDSRGDEFVSVHAIRDLQHRVAAGACLLDGETVRLSIPLGGESVPKS